MTPRAVWACNVGMRWVLAIVIVMLAAPAWGEEVLFCTETGVGKGATFIVKVISETQRTITNTTGDTRTLKLEKHLGCSTTARLLALIWRGHAPSPTAPA